jgi:hypothetical protein
MEMKKEKKLTIQVSPELDAAIRAAAWMNGKDRDQFVKETLENDPKIKEELKRIREEPDVGVHLVNPAFLKRISREQEKRTE